MKSEDNVLLLASPARFLGPARFLYHWRMAFRTIINRGFVRLVANVAINLPIVGLMGILG
jgi:hypothetical protein